MATGLNPSVRSNWSGVILVCRKCSKKIGGGFGPKGRTPLAKALRKQLELKKGRKARLGVVEVKCLGVCPSGGVTMVDTNAPDRWFVVPPGADLGTVADRLGVSGACSPSSGRHLSSA